MNHDSRSPYAEERSNQKYAQGNKEKHSLMRPIVIELKLDLKCLNKGKRHAIKMYFVEGKWLKNYLLAQLADKVGWCTSIETTMDSKLT